MITECQLEQLAIRWNDLNLTASLQIAHNHSIQASNQ